MLSLIVGSALQRWLRISADQVVLAAFRPVGTALVDAVDLSSQLFGLAAGLLQPLGQLLGVHPRPEYQRIPRLFLVQSHILLAMQ